MSSTAPETPSAGTVVLPTGREHLEAKSARFVQVGVTALTVAVSAGAAAAFAWSRSARDATARSGGAVLLGVAALAFVVGALSLVVGAAHGGKTAWAIARRATPDRAAFDRSDAFCDKAFKRASLLGLAALATGIVAACVDGSQWLLVAASAGLGFLGGAIAAGSAAVRFGQARGALGLMRRLRTTTLADLGRATGDVELALRVPADAPTFTLPFLAEPVAAAELRVQLDDGVALRTWPESIPVEDAGGPGALALDAFEIGGHRNAYDVLVAPPASAADVTPLLRAFEDALGRSLRAAQSSSFVWAVWGVLPGDTLYVIGEAPGVRRGVGAYRGGDGRVVRGDTERAATAYVGDEARLDALCAREVRAQGVAFAIAVAGAGVLAFAAIAAALS